jgi:hypothetical protein
MRVKAIIAVGGEPVDGAEMHLIFTFMFNAVLSGSVVFFLTLVLS